MPFADPDETVKISGFTEKEPQDRAYSWRVTRGRPAFDQVVSASGHAPSRRAAFKRARRALEKPHEVAWTEVHR